MGDLFELPQDAVRETFTFFERVKDKEVKNLVFLFKDNQLDCVEKKSVKGRWLVFTSKLAHLFGRESKIDKGVSRINDLLERVKGTDDALQAAAVPELIDETKKKAFNKLLDDLGAIHPLEEKSVTQVSTPGVTDQKVEEVLQKSKEAIRDGLQKDYPNVFTEDELAAISSFLASHPEHDVKDASAFKEVLVQALSDAPDEKIALYAQAIKKIHTDSSPVATDSPVSLKNMAMVFGDSFIKESGLEGGVNARPYADLAADCLETLELPSKHLQTVLRDAVDLRDATVSAAELREGLQARLKKLPEGEQRSLLFGGWAKHAIVYEIEKQVNGKFTLRIYNEGEGIEFHDRVREKYKEKYAGCIAISDISEQRLFRRSFLASLQALTSIDKGAEVLNKTLLPMLGGKEEKIDARVQHFVSPQQSGTCTYRSLQAFFAHVMTAEEYKHFKFKYKLFMLDKYLPQLEKRAQLPITTQEMYQEGLLEYGIIKRSIEKFSKGISHLLGGLYPEEVAQAKQKIKTCEGLLKILEQNIVSFEKKQCAEEPVSKLDRQEFIQPETLEKKEISHLEPKIGDLTVAPEKVSQKMVDAHSAIEQIPDNPSDPSFSQKIESCLVALNERMSHTEKIYLLDTFYKKLGSLHTLEQIQFQNPEKSIDYLKHYLGLLSDAITYSSLDRVGMMYATAYAIECAFRQLPDDKRILDKDFPTVLAAIDLNDVRIQSASSCDPFWVGMFQEIASIQEELQAEPYPLPDLVGVDTAPVVLDARMAKGIWAWWTRKENAPLLAKVEKSIQEDRKVQEMEIKTKTQSALQEIANLDGKKETLSTQEELRELQADIDKINLYISQIPRLVHNDPQFWPWGWETDLSVTDKASFLFGKHPNDFFQAKLQASIIPASLYDLFYSALLVKNATSLKWVTFELPVVTDIKEGKISLECQTKGNFRKQDSLCLNKYYQSLTWELKPIYASIIQSAQNDNWHETHAPNSAYDLCKSHAKLTQEEVVSLFSLHNRPIQIDATLSYFEEHFKKLADHNWFLLFHSLLFEPDILLDTLSEPLAERLKDFFDGSIQSAVELGDLATSANLLWAKAGVQRYIDRVSQGEAIFSLDEIVPLLLGACDPKYHAQRPAIFEAVVALASSQDPSKLTKEQLGFILLARIFQKQNPVTTGLNSQRKDEAERTDLIIKEYFTKNPDLKATELLTPRCLELLFKMYPMLAESTVTQEAQADVVSFITKDGFQTRLCLTSAEMKSNNTRLFQAFKDGSTKEQVEVLKKAGLYAQEEDVGYLVTYRDQGHIYIRDPKRKQEYAIGADGTLYVKMQTGLWAEQLPKEQAEYLKDNKELSDNFLHLQVGDTIYLCEPKTLTPRYSVTTSGVVEMQTGYKLVKSPPIASFRAFEANECTNYWADASGHLQKIEFPRYQLSFSREQVQGKDVFMCEQQKGWWLSHEQYAPHLGPTTGFLALVNSKGQKKLLLPLLEAKEEKERALTFSYSYDFQVERNRSARFIECDMKESKTLTARLVLGRIYLEKGFQDAAEELLYSVEVEAPHRELSDDERVLLEKIALVSLSKNTSLRAIRCRLHVLSILERDTVTYKRAQEVDGKNKIKAELYKAYLEGLRSVKPLEKHQELLLLSQLKPDETFNRRKRELEASCELEETPQFFPAQLPEKFTIKTVALTMGGLALEPRFGVKFDYWKARKQHTFPFDYTNKELTTDDFATYARLIMRECSAVRSVHVAKRNGLLPMLHYLSAFSQNSQIKEFADRALYEVYQNPKLHYGPEGRMQKPSPHPQELIGAKSKADALRFVQKGRINLDMLDKTEPAQDENSFLDALCTKTFDCTRVQKALDQTAALFSQDSPEIEDDDMRGEFEEMQEDIKVATSTLAEPEFHLLEGQTLDGLYEAIKDKHTAERQRLSVQEVQLQEACVAALTTDPVMALQFSSQKQKIPTVQELCILASRLDADSYIKTLYPQFSSEGIKNLKNAVKDLLVQKQYVQHLERSIEQVQNIRQAQNEGAPQEMIQAMYNDLGVNFSAKRAYDVANDPLALVFLVVETVFSIKLRSDQVEKIRKYKEAGDIGLDIVEQIIMGAGKSAVLQPILAFLFAKVGKLSTVCVPTSLFPSVVKTLSKALGSSFNKCVYADPFTRQLGKDKSYLKIYLSHLLEAKEQGHIVLYTPQHKYAIYSSLKEAYANDDQARVDLLSDICKELELHECVQIDEVDMAMDPEIIHKFPIGSKEPLDPQQASFATELVLRLARDEELGKKIALDFVEKFKARKNPDHKREGRELSLHMYAQDVLPRLKVAALDMLKEKSPDIARLLETDDGRSYIEAYLTQESPYDQQLEKLLAPGEEEKIGAHLPNDERGLKSIAEDESRGKKERIVAQKKLYALQRDSWLEQNIPNSPIRDLVGIASKTICKTLKKTLFKECGSNYGVDPKLSVFVARSYYAPDSPKPSIPSDTLEQLVTSVQLALFNGIPTNAVEKIVESWQRNASEEISKQGLRVDETASYKEFVRLLKDRAASFRFLDSPPAEEMIKALQQALSSDEKSLLSYVENYIVDQIVFYPESIETTPQVLPGMANQTVAYSGTVHAGILARSMQPNPEKGVDGKTISSVESKLMVGTSRIVEMDQSKKSYLEQVIDRFRDDSTLFTFIDSGNRLKEENLERYSEKCLQAAMARNIKGIIYPDPDGNWFVLSYDEGKRVLTPLEQSQLKPHERITIIPSKHETGTNIPQPPTAKAFVSIRKNMTLRDFLQCVFRMRKILAGQQVDFGISQEVKEHMATVLLQTIFDKQPSLLTSNFDEFVQSIKALPEDMHKALSHIDRQAWEAKLPAVRFALALDSFCPHLEINSKRLWNYLLANQVRQRKEKNWKAAKHRMQEVVEKPVRMVLTDRQIPYAERRKVFLTMRSIFTPTTKNAPFKEMCAGASQLVEATTACEYEKNRMLVALKMVLSDSTISQEVKDKVSSNVTALYREGVEDALKGCIDKKLIPRLIRIGGGETSEEIEQDIETEEEAEEEAEEEVDLAIEVVRQMGRPEVIGYTELLPTGDTLDALFDSKLFKEVDKEHSLFSSPNMFLTGSFASECHLPGNYLLILKDPPQKERYVIVSFEDAASLQERIEKGQITNTKSVALVTFAGKVKAHLPADKKPDLAEKDLLNVRVQAKLKTGRVRFKEDEIAALKEMVAKSESPKEAARKLKKEYEKILSYLPESAGRYKTSLIHRTLIELCEV